MNRLCVALSLVAVLALGARLLQAADKAADDAQPPAEVKAKDQKAADDQKSEDTKAEDQTSKDTKSALDHKRAAKKAEAKESSDDLNASSDLGGSETPKSTNHRHRLTRKQIDLLAILSQIEILKALPEDMSEEVAPQIDRLEKLADRLRTRAKLKDWEPEKTDLDKGVKLTAVRWVSEMRTEALELRAMAARMNRSAAGGGRYQVQRGKTYPGFSGGRKVESKDLTERADKLQKQSEAVVKAASKITGDDLFEVKTKTRRRGKNAFRFQ